MPLVLDDLITELKVHAPVGVSVPREPDSSDVREATIQRWAEDAAQAINSRRGKTTRLETTITVVADQELYDLPGDAREVVGLIRATNAPQGTTKVLDIPRQTQALGYGGAFGHLPTGQTISGSIDLLNRQALARTRREDDHDLHQGQLRLLFPLVAGEKIVVRYMVIDRDFTALPTDYFTLVHTYLLYQNIEWHLGKYPSNLSQDADRLVDEGQGSLFRRRAELVRVWREGLGAIGLEAN